jgi:hypothetical protein|tara:strand:- start:42676 stop:43077 length:402 start_codon:yes stop_codon:yes gene_type:complete
MHVHSQYYKKITSDQVGYIVEPSEVERTSVSSVIIEIPEGVNLTSLPGISALTIPHFSKATYIKVIVDGNILGSGGFGSGGGIVNNASNADLKVSGSGLVRGGGATTGAIRDALQGPSDINDNTKDIPRIFNF